MSDIVGQLILQLFLIILNAFFAATEIAVISLNERKVRARADEGDKKAVRMLNMIENPTQFLSTIQIGITLAGFLGSAFAADNFASKLSGVMIRTFGLSAEQTAVINTVSVIVITLILSFFTLVLGELVPKRVAMKHKEKLAERVCGFISTLAVLLKPFIFLLTVSTNAILRLLGIDPYEKDEPVSEEDIVLMLDAGKDDGSLEENDIEYIKNVFKLDKMTAEDVMTPKKSVVYIYDDEDFENIVNIIEEEDFSRIPVINDEEDRITGVLHAREFLLKYRKEGFRLEDAMMEPSFVPESAPLDQILNNMQKEHRHMVIVVNEYGETSGVVTMEDIFEELVGEIWDEGDDEVEEFIALEDGSYRVMCSAYVEDFLELFGIEEDEESDATTVNGWIIEQLGCIPKQGTEFEYGKYVIKVTVADDLMAEEIIVSQKKTDV